MSRRQPPSAANEILWKLTVEDYRAWRSDFNADKGDKANQEELELNLLKAWVQSNSLAHCVVDIYLTSYYVRPKEVVNPLAKNSK